MQSTKQSNNILVINSETDESEISYRKTMVESSFEYTPEFNELMNLFNDDPDILFKVNTKKCICLVDKSDNKYSISEYKPDMDIVFIKITNDILKKHDAEIFIDFDFYINSEVKYNYWSESPIKSIYTENMPYYPKDIHKYTYDIMTHSIKIKTNTDVIDIAMNIIDGWPICKDIIQNQSDDIEPSAIVYCNKLKVCNDSYKGYLPSLYQMNQICMHMPLMEYFIRETKSNGTKMFYKTNGTFWTANEFDDAWTFTVTQVNKYNEICLHEKIDKRLVFPIFKKMK